MSLLFDGIPSVSIQDSMSIDGTAICTAKCRGWTPSFKWLLNDRDPDLKLKDLMYQDDFISPKAATSVSTLIVLNPEKCPGQYRCQVTFKMNYNGEEMTLCTQSEPANLKKVPETSVDELAAQMEALTTVSGHSASTNAKDAKGCDVVYHKFSNYDPTTIALCHAFYCVGEIRDSDDDDCQEMMGPATRLIEADWTDKHVFHSKVEEQFMQPIVRDVLLDVLGSDFPFLHWKGESHAFKDIDFDGQHPDGVVLNLLQSLAVLIEESKIDAGAGDYLVQLLEYLRRLASKVQLEGVAEPLQSAMKAYPCFLLGMRGKHAQLYGAIRLPEGKGKEAMKIHYCLLAEASFRLGNEKECAKFLMKLQRGVHALNQMWEEKAECMKFNSDPNYRRVLPCDCVARLLDQSKQFQFTKHLVRNVFEVENKEDESCIVKLAVSRYGSEAHERCAKKRMAPELFNCVPLPSTFGCVWAIMMRKLDTNFVPLNYLFLKMSSADCEAAEKIKEKMKEALEMLHGDATEGKRLVHGDFRAPNVYVSWKNGDDVKVQLIDFDWSGVEEKQVYPSTNVLLNWPEGVRCGAPLKAEHDWNLYRAHCYSLDCLTKKVEL